MSEKLTFGMVGGGAAALIGDVHRKSATFDGKAKIVSGCFSRGYENTLETGRQLGIDQRRLYKDYKEMAEKEGARADKIDFVSIVTPNNTHYEIAKAFLKNGINIVCDKPLCFTAKEAEELTALAKKSGLLNCMTYTNSGYPMVKQAREMIKNGELGRIYMVLGEYAQEWLARPIEQEGSPESIQGHKQASWRTDPKLSGISNCVADIGTHIENTAAYMTGLGIDSLCANMDKFVKGRLLDDNAEILLKFKGGARGIFWCSQVAIGCSNGNLRIRVFGEKGSLEWNQETADDLRVAFYGQPVQNYSRGRDNMYPLSTAVNRLPNGLREGYYEAFMNIYNNFIDALIAKKEGKPVSEPDFQTFEAGLDGIRFVDRCVESSNKGAKWVDYK